MRLIEGRKLNGVAFTDITRGVPCKRGSDTSIIAFTSAPNSEAVVLVDKLEDNPYGNIPATISKDDKVIYAYQGLFEYNDATLAAAVVVGDIVEWTATGVQNLHQVRERDMLLGFQEKQF